MNKKEALKLLHSTKEGIPFEAIEFLYNHPKDHEIEGKIAYNLSHAYDERLTAISGGNFSNAPLWYSILAEAHASEKLIAPLITLFTTPDAPDWDLLSEQGLYLVGLYSEKIPGAVDKFISAIEKEVDKKSNSPYLFLFDTIKYADEKIFSDRIKKLLLNKNTNWKALFAVNVAEAGLKTCEPELQKLHKEFEVHTTQGTPENMVRLELEYAVNLLINGGEETPCYYQQRDDWKVHYTQAEHLFRDETPMLSNEVSNIGRNDMCPCGSGKKYKKCCMNNS
jgi:uncharacterized protein YchJ